MQNVQPRVIPLDASIRREVLELAREHDQKLKSLEQDLFRTETKLKVEQRWRWVDRGVCLMIGSLGMAWAISAGMAQLAWQAMLDGLGELGAYLTARIHVYGIPVPLNALLLAGAAFIVLMVLAAILSLKPSPERAARELMRRVDRDPAVQGFIFRDGTIPQSSYEMERERSSDDAGFNFPPASLEHQLQAVLHPVATRRTLQ